MCGITGFLTVQQSRSGDWLRHTVVAMADALQHRGPDDQGVWVDAEAGIALGHRRLSIIDLTPLGHQPMVSADGRFVLTYNGEVYNHGPMRADLEAAGYPFKGHSDTEVLLAGIVHWGLANTLRRANGMFALAVWDRGERTLTLARDRAGKKPLYYGRCGRTFLFGSELKALRKHPAFIPDIDRNALGLYMRYSWMPAPHTIFRGIRQLPAASYLQVTGDDPHLQRPKAYWSAREVAEAGSRSPLDLSLEEITGELDRVLRQAVALRMVADVNVGAFLSGGIDSSVVVALMQAQSPRPIKTFTIGFDDKAYDEAEFARATAKHLGTDHTDLYVSPADCMAVIPELPTLYDEPLGDYSQVPTFLVASLARRQVTVSLSGDGGDELFAGYNSYPSILGQWTDAQHQWALLPPSLRQPMATSLHQVAAWGQDRLRREGSAPFDVVRKKLLKLLRKMEKRVSPLTCLGPADLYGRHRDRFFRSDAFVIGAGQSECLLTQQQAWAESVDPLLAMQHLDFITYMADDVLVKVDRASMGTSLEVRCPMLDPAVVAFAWSLPPAGRLGPEGGKAALRRVLARYLPEAMFERPKQGFGLPVEDWLRGPLRDWGEALLDEGRLRMEGFLVPETVRRIWNQHIAGKKEHTFLLWSVLMFQAWHEYWSRPVTGLADRSSRVVSQLSTCRRA